MTKLYCYVDESGQDTQGEFFIVAVVVVGTDARDELIASLEVIERETTKGRLKWSDTNRTRRVEYIRSIVNLQRLAHKINFAYYADTLDYLPFTVSTIEKALTEAGEGDFTAIVLIDALPPSQARRVGNLLHQSGMPVKKVRGVRREESDALIRLADAVCGWVRDSHEQKNELRVLFTQAIRKGILRDLGK